MQKVQKVNSTLGFQLRDAELHYGANKCANKYADTIYLLDYPYIL